MSIYHFDLNPNNVICNGFDFRIIDFGSAKLVKDVPKNPNSLISKSSKIQFTFENTQLFSSKRLDCDKDGNVVCDKFDIYSLGCIFYYVLMNKYL